MTSIWLRRGLLLAAASLATVLAGCGAGTVFSALLPSRFIVFGDAFNDVGQGGAKYTVNDGSANTWVDQVASNYGKTVSANSAGGLGYARGNARVTLKPDAAGATATLTVREQIDTFMAAGGKFAADDVVVVNGGISDLVVQGQALSAGSISSAELVARAAQAGVDMGTQVRRLVGAGATHVVVTGVYDLSKSPWASAIGQVSALSTASIQFNTSLLTSIVDLGANVLYIDSAYYLNLLANLPASYGLSNSTSAACNSVDAGPGIGIGAGQVNSALCNTSTIVGGVDYKTVMFADNLYLTPVANRLFGDYAAARMRTRW